jgi:hypothetical protein
MHVKRAHGGQISGDFGGMNIISKKDDWNGGRGGFRSKNIY